MSIIKHKIVKYVTDRPGQVVYKDDIINDGGFTAKQVTAAMLGIQRDGVLEIQTIVQGNAWRYTPSRSTVNNGQPVRPDLTRPLIGMIREYFKQRPGEIISVQALMGHTGRTEAQVKVGVNNARNGDPTFKANLTTVVAGNLWRYDPVTAATRQPVPTPVPRPLVTLERPVPTKPAEEDDAGSADVIRTTAATDGSARLFEEIGTTDNGQVVIIRDGDGRLYRATPLK